MYGRITTVKFLAPSLTSFLTPFLRASSLRARRFCYGIPVLANNSDPVPPQPTHSSASPPPLPSPPNPEDCCGELCDSCVWLGYITELQNALEQRGESLDGQDGQEEGLEKILAHHDIDSGVKSYLRLEWKLRKNKRERERKNREKKDE